MSDTEIPHTPTQLRTDWQALGLSVGQVVMLHASVKSVGQVLGGPNTILQTLMDTLTSTGTLMMYAGWEDIPNFLDELSPDLQQIYREHHPPFDPTLARAVRENGILVEFLRTWTGIRRSLNPEASMVAWGAQAAWLTQDHPLNYGYGTGSPLAKLVEAQGQVVLLGSPLSRITLLHHAEYRARLRHKKIIRYRCPILRDGETVWVEIEDYETGEPHDQYTFGAIARAYLTAGNGQQGQVGAATAYLFDAAHLVQFAMEWLEARFGVAG